MFGKLTVEAIPYHEPVIMGATAFMALMVIATVTIVTKLGKWGWLWREYLTSTDHKHIGTMYLVLAFLMLVRGFADAVMMRLQQAVAMKEAGPFSPHHYAQIFS